MTSSLAFPLVSIIIPTYNRAHLIGESIKSVVDQSYRNWELIIVDDGSEDETERAVRSLNHPRIHYYKIAHSGILGKVRNHGIKKAQGDYIAFLDSDDLWRNDKLEFQMRLFSEYDIYYTFSNGSHFGEGVTVQPPELQDLAVGNLFHDLILNHKYMIYMPSLLFKKAVFNQIHMINENMKSGGDVDFVYRMAQKFNGAFSNERLVSIRKHNYGMSSQYHEIAHLEDIKIIDRFRTAGAVTNKQANMIIADHYYKLGLLELRKVKMGKTFYYFMQHAKLNPFNYKGWIRLLQAGIQSISK
jgi:glycosyltransferase involved in cell wall biosynthesis